jgi:hypothetical protein
MVVWERRMREVPVRRYEVFASYLARDISTSSLPSSSRNRGQYLRQDKVIGQGNLQLSVKDNQRV